MKEYHSNHNVVYSCHYHVIWCVKYRRKLLKDGIDSRLKELLLEQAVKMNFCIDEMEVMPDHIHLLISVDPQFGIHRAVKALKGYSSRFLRQEYPFLKQKVPTLWTNSYFVTTAGGVSLDVIQKYIQNQKTSAKQTGKMG